MEKEMGVIAGHIAHRTAQKKAVSRSAVVAAFAAAVLSGGTALFVHGEREVRVLKPAERQVRGDPHLRAQYDVAVVLVEGNSYLATAQDSVLYNRYHRPVQKYDDALQDAVFGILGMVVGAAGLVGCFAKRRKEKKPVQPARIIPFRRIAGGPN